MTKPENYNAVTIRGTSDAKKKQIEETAAKLDISITELYRRGADLLIDYVAHDELVRQIQERRKAKGE